MTDISSLVDSVLSVQNVEYRKLGDVATIVRGKGLQKKDFTESGVGCIHYGQIYTSFGPYTEKTLTFVNLDDVSRFTIVSKGDIIMAVTGENTEDICKSVAWLGDEDIVTGSHSAVIKHSLDPKYLSYYFQSEAFFQKKKTLAHGTKVIEVTPSDLEDVLIPVPSMDVQRAIVEVLDAFSLAMSNCKQQNDLRLIQFNQYAPRILSGEFESEYGLSDACVLGDILDYEQPQAYIVKSSEYLAEGQVPVLTAGQSFILGYTDETNGICHASPSEPVIIFDDFTTSVQWVDFDFKVKSSAMKILRSKDGNPETLRYAYYVLKLSEYTPIEHARQWISTVSQFEVDLWSADTQHSIVCKLDSLFKIIEVLEQEYLARSLQYGYCRDLILSFGGIES